MADLVISDAAIQDLQSGFENIQSNLDLVNNPDAAPGPETTGAPRLTYAVNGFNRHVSSTKNKYAKKTNEFIEFLSTVMEGSGQADSEMASAISMEDQLHTVA